MEDPYKILGVEKTVTKDQLLKAYRKLQNRYHPDRKTGDKEMYNKIHMAYTHIQLYPEIKYINVSKFISEYKNSEEEKKDILELYYKYKGNMCKVIDNLVLASDEDEERIRNVIDGAVKGVKFKIYEKKVCDNLVRRRKRNKEAKLAEEDARKLGVDLNEPLEEVLNRRWRTNVNFIKHLEEKYIENKKLKKPKPG